MKTAEVYDIWEEEENQFLIDQEAQPKPGSKSWSFPNPTNPPKEHLVRWYEPSNAPTISEDAAKRIKLFLAIFFFSSFILYAYVPIP